jgi:hypothetical protein
MNSTIKIAAKILEALTPTNNSTNIKKEGWQHIKQD